MFTFDFTCGLCCAEPLAKAAAGQKRKQVVLSESDDPSGEASASDSGSDWGEKAAQAGDVNDEDDDDAVSMVDSPAGSSDNDAKPEASSRKRKKAAPANVGNAP